MLARPIVERERDQLLSYGTLMEESCWEDNVDQHAQGLAELIGAQIKAGRDAAAEALFDLYVSRVMPHLQDKHRRLNDYVAADMLVVESRRRDKALFNKIWRTLGSGRTVARSSDARLLFNLACHYAVAGNKTELLHFTGRALALGKPPAQFRADADFAAFQNDPDFIRLLNRK